MAILIQNYPLILNLSYLMMRMLRAKNEIRTLCTTPWDSQLAKFWAMLILPEILREILISTASAILL